MNQARLSELANACRRREPGAFEILYQQYAEVVFHVASRVLQNHDDAADVLQETFLTAYRKMDTFRGEGSLKAWLCQIAVRGSLRLRTKRRGDVALEEEGVPALEAPMEADPDIEFREAVGREIDRLPERARLVFTLHTVEGLTHADIARVLEINEGTSKSQLSYARSLLRQRLEKWSRDILG